jgi:hypothetical protein
MREPTRKPAALNALHIERTHKHEHERKKPQEPVRWLDSVWKEHRYAHAENRHRGGTQDLDFAAELRQKGRGLERA